MHATYPEGAYFAYFHMVTGQWGRGIAVLWHDLPAEPMIVSPGPGAVVPVRYAMVRWLPDPTVESRVVEIEHDGLGLNCTATLPRGTDRFLIPNGFLVEEEEFQLSVGAFIVCGNLLIVEKMFVVDCHEVVNAWLRALESADVGRSDDPYGGHRARARGSTCDAPRQFDREFLLVVLRQLGTASESA